MIAMVMMTMTGDNYDDDELLCRSVSPSTQAGCPPRSPCTEPGHRHFKDDDEVKTMMEMMMKNDDDEENEDNDGNFE